MIELIKKLPPVEMAEVIAFAKSAGTEIPTPEQKIRYIPTGTFAEVRPRVFAQHDELFRRLAE